MCIPVFGLGAQTGPSPKSRRDSRGCPCPSLQEEGLLSEDPDNLPGTVEDVVLFVFPGVEQHDHTPGEMR